MPKGINEGHSVRIFIRLTPELRDHAREASRQLGVEFSEWVRAAIHNAAQRTCTPPKTQQKRRRKLARR
jgi:hypothetical protein